MTAKKIDAVV